MSITFHKNDWEDYLYWKENDKKKSRKINLLIKETLCDPFGGKNKPEPLKHNYGCNCSKRIDLENRLVYKFENRRLYIVQLRYHY